MTRDPVERLCQYTFVDSSGLKIPYCASVDIQYGTYYHVNRVVIIMAGLQRNANDYYDDAIDAWELAGGHPSTIVFAPQLLIHADAEGHGLDEYYLSWSYTTLSLVGGLSGSGNYASSRVSSFEVMNEILMAFDDTNVFPDLVDIVMFGHSGGAQFVQRYAAGGSVEESLSVSITYVVGNPGAYFYFSPKRPLKGTLDQFIIPTENCSGYDDYKFGLENMNSYMESVGAETLRYNFQLRTVHVILGELDVTSEHHLDETCKGMLQGKNRLERGRIFHNHIQQEFGVDNVAHHGLFFVAGSEHNRTKMMKSSCGLYLLYGYGDIDTACSRTMSPTLFGLCRDCDKWTVAAIGAVAVAGMVGCFALLLAMYYPQWFRGGKKDKPLLSGRSDHSSSMIL